MIYSDGSKYEGEWQKGKQHGLGTFTFPDGKIKSGKWAKGEFLGEQF